jgi:alkyl hydroperoxide reductase subunit AhpC
MKPRGTKDGNEEYSQPFCAHTTDTAPLFSAEAYENVEKKITKINLEDYRGKWVILFFYASDFTFV